MWHLYKLEKAVTANLKESFKLQQTRKPHFPHALTTNSVATERRFYIYKKNLFFSAE